MLLNDRLDKGPVRAIFVHPFENLGGVIAGIDEPEFVAHLEM
jgi:hypothetical protein